MDPVAKQQPLNGMLGDGKDADALGDHADETEFMTISYWESVEAMARFTGGDPNKIHHLPRDEELLIELPRSVQVLRLLTSDGDKG